MTKQTVNATVEIDLDDLARVYGYNDGQPDLAPVLKAAVGMVANGIEKQIADQVKDAVQARIEEQVDATIKTALESKYSPVDEWGNPVGQPTSLEKNIIDMATKWLGSFTTGSSNNSYNESAGRKWLREVVQTQLREMFNQEFKKYNDELRLYMKDFIASHIASKIK